MQKATYAACNKSRAVMYTQKGPIYAALVKGMMGPPHKTFKINKNNN